MVTRRELIVTVAGTGITTALAGCSSGGGSESDPAENTTESTPETEEDEQSAGFVDFAIEDITLTYSFSDGLNATVIVRNQHEDGTGVKSVNISIVAYDGDTRLGEDSQWQDVNAELTREFDLLIGSVSQFSDSPLEDVTELRVRGKEEGNEYVTLETFSGDSVRNQVEDS